MSAKKPGAAEAGENGHRPERKKGKTKPESLPKQKQKQPKATTKASSHHDEDFLESVYQEASAERKRSHFRKGIFLGVGTIVVALTVSFFCFRSVGRGMQKAHNVAEALPSNPHQIQREASGARRATDEGSGGSNVDATATSESPESIAEGTPQPTNTDPVENITTALYDRSWELIETYVHDTSSFTQGLEIAVSCTNRDSCMASYSDEEVQNESCSEDAEGILVTESTGMYGDSLVRIWDLASGEVVRERKMEDRYFGEGLTQYTDNDGRELLVVLTYMEQTILVYDANTLEPVRTIHPFPSMTTTGQGWGIAFDRAERIFIVTDGSSSLFFWNLDFEAIPSRPPVTVRLEEMVDDQNKVLIPRGGQGTILSHINELEWDPYTKTLLANKWFEHVILRIDPYTGLVIRVYDVGTLHPRDPDNKNEDVLNGIAILPFTEGKEWLLTGKYWPEIYRIRILE